MSDKDTKDTKANPGLEAINTTINASIASLMDACNYLRDIPKLAVANQSLSAEVASLREKLKKYEPEAEVSATTNAA